MMQMHFVIAPKKSTDSTHMSTGDLIDPIKEVVVKLKGTGTQIFLYTSSKTSCESRIPVSVHLCSIAV